MADRRCISLIRTSSLSWLSNFTIGSLGVILFRRGQQDVFVEVIQDMLVDGGMHVLHLEAVDLVDVANIAQRFNLDYDDAYQYGVAQRQGLRIVSFDADFDRTDRGRQTPAQVLAQRRADPRPPAPEADASA